MKLLKLLRFDIIFLTLASAGLLVISGSNTLHIMSGGEKVTPVAVASVAALELGLAGIILRLEVRGKFLRWLDNAVLYLAAIVVLLLLVTTNTLSKVEAINLALSPLLYGLIEVGVLGAMVPILAALSWHHLNQAVREVMAENEGQEVREERKRTTPRKLRLQDISRRLQRHETINQTELARIHGVSESTIKRDVDEVKKSLQISDDPSAF